MCLFHCVIATEFDYRIQYNRFRAVLHAVDSLNVKHGKKNKAILYHADISKQYFSVCQLKIVSYFLHKLSKGQGVVTSLYCINGQLIQTLLRE